MTKELLQQTLDALRHSIPSRRPGEDAYCERGWSEHKAAITALRSALAAPMPEPVAWYLPSPDGNDSIFRDHRTVIACTGNKWEGFVPLYAAPPAAPAPADLIPPDALFVCGQMGANITRVRAESAAPVVREPLPGVLDPDCNYMAVSGRVCNKCGRIHHGIGGGGK